MTAMNKPAGGAFLLQLERRVRQMQATDDILALLTQMLGQRLGAQQVLCLDVGQKLPAATLLHAWNDAQTPAGAADYFLGDELHAQLLDEWLAAHPVAVSDVSHDTRTATPASLAMFARLSIQALLHVPIVREGQLAALFVIHSRKARLWHAEEIELAVHVSERIWSTIVRARAEEQLRILRTDMERLVAERARALGRTWKISPDLLGVLNLDGYFEHSNPAWQATLGWSEEEIRSMRFLDLLHPDDLERTHATWEAAKQGQPALRFENRYRHKLGGWHWLSWVAVPEGNKLYCSARDISLEKKTAAELAAHHRMAALQVPPAPHGSVAHDLKVELQIIADKLQLLQASVGSDAPAALQLASCQAAIERGTALAAQLLSTHADS